MKEKIIDYLIFSAEKKEVAPFLKKAEEINERSFYSQINNKKILIIITGVGKKSIKRTLKNQSTLLEQIKVKKIFNLGNSGALKKIKSSTILKIGKCLGHNGKEKVIIDSNSHIENISVNSLQDKRKLFEQFPNSYTVDMELFHLAKAYPKINSYKIVLDTFRFNPQSVIFKIFLPVLIKRNSKLLYNFFTKKYC